MVGALFIARGTDDGLCGAECVPFGGEILRLAPQNDKQWEKNILYSLALVTIIWYIDEKCRNYYSRPVPVSEIYRLLEEEKTISEVVL